MVLAKAVTIEGKGGPEVLSIGELQVRDPGPGELLVQVAAAGLNRADTLQRRGFYPAPPGAPAQVPGLEYAGTVRAIGEGVTEYAVGDRVMGIVAGGGMATHLTVHAREAIAVPEAMTLTDAAAVPEVFLTAYDALNLQGGMSMGNTVLLHAVGSGIGTAAMQLAAATGASVIGTSRSADKLERCAKLGALTPIHVQDKSFAKQVLEATGGAGVDLVLDVVGAAYLADNVKALRPGGHIVVIGLLGGAMAELPMGLLLAKRASITGTVLRSRPLEEKASLAQSFSRAVLPLFTLGQLSPVIDKVIPMEEIGAAHAYMESNQSFGKVVMTW